MSLIIGSHVSFTKDKQLLGSVMQTIDYGANTFMFYTGAPQNTNRMPINNDLTKEALILMEKNNIDKNNVIIHAPYIINLANSNNESNYNFAISFLKQEIRRATDLGIKKIVVHPGSHLGNGIEYGLKNIIFALNQVLEDNPNIIICLETMAGKGSECGKSFTELKTIIDGVIHSDKVMVCLDTCHLNDAGYDLNSFDKLLEEFDRIIGINKIGCIHINDSKNDIDTHKDRHENIGYGKIGYDNLIKIIYHEKLKDVPKILETPFIDKEYPPYKFEIEMIKKKEFNNNLLDDIRNHYC